MAPLIEDQPSIFRGMTTEAGVKAALLLTVAAGVVFFAVPMCKDKQPRTAEPGVSQPAQGGAPVGAGDPAARDGKPAGVREPAAEGARTQTPDDYLRLGIELEEKGDKHSASEMLRQAEALCSQHSPNSNKHARIIAYQARNAGLRRDYGEAEGLWRRAIEIQEGNLGKDHDWVAMNLISLSCLYHDQGRHRDSKKALARVLNMKNIKEQTRGTAHYWMGDICMHLNQYEEAEGHCKRALNRTSSTARPRSWLARSINTRDA